MYHRKYIVYISSDRKFLVWIPARTVRQETVHDLRKHTEYSRLDNAVLHVVHNFAIRFECIHGTKHRFQRGTDIVIRRRNNGTPAQRVDGLIGVFVIMDRWVNDVHPGISVRMEDSSTDQRSLSCDLYMPRFFRMSVQIFPLVLFDQSCFLNFNQRPVD